MVPVDIYLTRQGIDWNGVFLYVKNILPAILPIGAA